MIDVLRRKADKLIDKVILIFTKVKLLVSDKNNMKCSKRGL